MRVILAAVLGVAAVAALAMSLLEKVPVAHAELRPLPVALRPLVTAASRPPEAAPSAAPAAIPTEAPTAADAPADAAPADAAPADAAPADAAPADAAPADAAPADAPRGTPARVAPSPQPAPTPKPPAGAPAARPVAPAGEGLLNLRASDTADVFLDGKRLGGSPVLGQKVKAGAHKVRFDCFDAAGNTVPGATRSVTVGADEEKDVEFDCPASE